MLKELKDKVRRLEATALQGFSLLQDDVFSSPPDAGDSRVLVDQALPVLEGPGVRGTAGRRPRRAVSPSSPDPSFLSQNRIEKV